MVGNRGKVLRKRVGNSRGAGSGCARMYVSWVPRREVVNGQRRAILLNNCARVNSWVLAGIYQGKLIDAPRWGTEGTQKRVKNLTRDYFFRGCARILKISYAL